MTISVFPRTDGPYLAFDDHDHRRYVLETTRARFLLDRLGAHVGGEPDRTLVCDRIITRDPLHDLTVTDIYIQDCDNLFEVMTSTGPMLSLSPVEACTLLRLAVERSIRTDLRKPREIPRFVQDSVISALSNAGEFTGASYG